MFNCCRRFVLAGGVSILTLAMSGNSAAQSLFGKRTALFGFDPVSYFDPGQPERGSKEFTAPFDDAIYQFKSAERRALFIADPERYAPQYHAYCAGSMAAGSKSTADPQVWVIQDGKLYVFGGPNALAAFRADPAAMVAKADATWAKVYAKR